MKKLLIYSFILPDSLPELRNKVKARKLPGTTWIGSIIQENGKLDYEGATPELSLEIQKLVESFDTLWLNLGKTIKVKKGEKIIEVLHQSVAYPVKRGDYFFLDALRDKLAFGHYRLAGGEITVKMEYSSVEEAKEDLRRMKAKYPSEEILEPEEFAKKYPDWAHLIEGI